MVKSAHLLLPILSDDSNDHREIKRCKFMQCVNCAETVVPFAVGRLRIKGCGYGARQWQQKWGDERMCVVDKVDRFSACAQLAARIFPLLHIFGVNYYHKYG